MVNAEIIYTQELVEQFARAKNLQRRLDNMLQGAELDETGQPDWNKLGHALVCYWLDYNRPAPKVIPDPRKNPEIHFD
jgi:hypothetical protein